MPPGAAIGVGQKILVGDRASEDEAERRAWAQCSTTAAPSL
jgi:hypothetical protein